MVQYAVLMADVKNSRSYRSVARDNLQILLSESISSLNEISESSESCGEVTATRTIRYSRII